jgi:hypothetical protein
MIALLTPSERADLVSDWQVLAIVNIELKDSSSVWLTIYSLEDEDVGAFAAGADADHRIYYRGGNTRRARLWLNRAISSGGPDKGSEKAPVKTGKE